MKYFVKVYFSLFDARTFLFHIAASYKFYRTFSNLRAQRILRNRIFSTSRKASSPPPRRKEIWSALTLIALQFLLLPCAVVARNFAFERKNAENARTFSVRRKHLSESISVSFFFFSFFYTTLYKFITLLKQFRSVFRSRNFLIVYAKES